MRIIKQIQLFIVLMLISIGAFALPAAFNASYTVSKSGLTLGEMRMSLIYKNNTYAYHKSTKATGLASWLSGDKMVENSEGKVDGNYIQSTSYLFHHTSKRKNRKDQFKFTAPNKVKGQYNDQAYDVQVPHGTMDRATLELALARDLALKKKVLNYSVTEKGKVKSYHLKRLGQEKVTVRGKEYMAEKLMVARKGTTRKTTFWLVKEFDYMPAKIDHIEKGSSIVTKLKWFKFLDKAK